MGQYTNVHSQTRLYLPPSGLDNLDRETALGTRSVRGICGLRWMPFHVLKFRRNIS